MPKLPKKMPTKMIESFVLITIGILLALTIMEIILRVMGLNMVEYLVKQPDARFGWIYEPNQKLFSCNKAIRSDCFNMRTNNQSLREVMNTSFDSSPLVNRILVVGDSQTAGSQVGNSETYADLLEEMLNNNERGNRYEVLNAGVDAYSLVQEWLWIRELGFRYQPQIVLVGLYIGNDLLDNVEIAPAPQPHFMRSSTGALVLTDHPLELVNRSKSADFMSTLKGMARPLYLYQMLRHYANYSFLTGSLRRIGLLRPEPPHHSSDLIQDDKRPRAASVCQGCVLQSLSQQYYFGSLPRQEELAFSILRETLQHLKADTDAHNTGLVVLLIPTKLQVDPETDQKRLDETKSLLGLHEDVTDFDQQMYNKILSICRNLDINVVDLLPGFQAYHEGNRNSLLYFNGDWHLSPSGHRIVMMQIYQFLEANHQPLLQ